MNCQKHLWGVFKGPQSRQSLSRAGRAPMFMRTEYRDRQRRRGQALSKRFSISIPMRSSPNLVYFQDSLSCTLERTQAQENVLAVEIIGDSLPRPVHVLENQIFVRGRFATVPDFFSGTRKVNLLFGLGRPQAALCCRCGMRMRLGFRTVFGRRGVADPAHTSMVKFWTSYQIQSCVLVPSPDT